MQFVRACAITLVSVILSVGARAQDLLVDCFFDNTLMKPKKKERMAEKEAWEWYESEEFRRRTFVVNMDSLQIIDGPGSQEVWRDPRVTLTATKLKIEWRFWSAPLSREARIELELDRFKGDALESYSMLKAPNVGPRLMYWGRTGKCLIEQRRF